MQKTLVTTVTIRQDVSHFSDEDLNFEHLEYHRETVKRFLQNEVNDSDVKITVTSAVRQDSEKFNTNRIKNPLFRSEN